MSTPAATPPLADPVAEGRRLAGSARAADLALRVTGGVGIALTCPSAGEPPLARSYADIDLAGLARDRKRIVALLEAMGYEPDRQFNALHGARRLFFWDRANGRQADVFLDEFEMCHKIDLVRRVAVPGPTLPLADLLLCKLQIVETNPKDLTDMLALLVDHDFGGPERGIDLPYLTGLASSDWGLWRTVTMVAERVDHRARELEAFPHRQRVHDQVRALLEALESVPKSRGWRMRARVGDRVRWYVLPEEAH